MRPYTDTNPSSPSSSSSAYQDNQFNGGRQSPPPRRQQTNDSDQHSARMHTRAPSSHPLQTDEAHQENKQSTDQRTSEQEYEHAQRRLDTLKYFVNQLNGAKEFDLAEAMSLFKQLKSADTALKRLAREGSEDDLAGLQQFGAGMTTCLNHFERFLASGKLIKPGLQVDGMSFPANTLLSSLDAEDVHQVFNGLSTLIDEGLRSHLFNNRQFEKLGKPLRDINHTLLVQAMLKGLPSDLPSNGCLLDILNLQSRGLKSKLLAEDSKLIRALFGRALAIIEQWPTETGTPVTEAGKIVSRQLAKTLVQLNTIKSFNLIKLDKSATGQANKRRLGQLVLALCNEAALDELTVKRNPDKPADKPIRVLPKGVEVTNISNTVKDFLEAGYLNISEPNTHTLLEQLCRLIGKIPPTDMQQRSGQTLGNCGNFLRVLLECALRPSASTALLQSPAYQAACASLLTTTASFNFWSGMDWYGKPDQTLANNASFLKAMEKWEQVDSRQLQTASEMLVQQIQNFGTEYITDAQSVSSILSALVVLGTLAPKAEVPILIEQLLQTVAQQATNKWPAKSRAIALRAALTWQAKGRSLQANPAIDALIKAGAVIDDALPYLQAIRLRVKELAKQAQAQADRLKGFQAMLRHLMPARAQNPEPISLSEIEQAISDLEAGEPAVAVLELIATVDTTVSSSSSASTSSTSREATQPAIPGLTQLRPATTASSSNTYTTSTASSRTASTTLSSPIKPTANRRRANTSDEPWEAPANVLGNQKPDTKASTPAPLNPGKPGNLVQSSTAPIVATRPANAKHKSEPKNTPQKAGSTNSAKPGSTTRQEKPEATSPRGLSDKAKATMESQWFDVVRNRKMKGRTQVLEQLVLEYPALTGLKDNKGIGQMALYDALALGDVALVEWLLPRMPVLDEEAVVDLLFNLFEAPIVVDAAVKEALENFMHMLGQALNGKVARRFGPQAVAAPMAYRDTLNQFKEKIENDPTEELDDNEHMYTLDDSIYKPILKTLERSINKVKASNPLLAAVFAGDLKKVNLLLASSNAANMISGVENDTQMNPLMVAIVTKHEAIANRLLQTEAGKASTLTKNCEGQTALYMASAYNQIAIVNALLALPNAVAQTEIYDVATGVSPFMWAAGVKNYPIARLLSKVPGAENQAFHMDGKLSMLHKAIINGDRKMIDILLAMPNSSAQLAYPGGEMHCNALGFALIRRDGKDEIAEYLLKQPEAEQLVFAPVTPSGANAFMYAITQNMEPLVKIMLASSYGARLSLHAIAKDQKIPLMRASKQGKSNIVKHLLAMDTATAQAMRVNDAGMNAMMLAACNGHINVVKQLIALPNAADQARLKSKSAEINEQHQDPEKMASQTSYVEVEEPLLKKHILSSMESLLSTMKKLSTLKIEDIRGKNAWEMASIRGHTDIAALLLPFQQNQ